jgi:hypothetical protein
MESPEGTAVGGEEEVDEAELEPAVAGADGGVAEDDGDEDSNTE